MANPHPVFSVVVPSVGRSDLLALQVLALTILLGRRPAWEVIVVADCPPPQLPGLSDLAHQWVVVEPLPANDLRNIGARLCSGEYLIFLDDDDFIYGNWARTFELLNDGSDLLSVSADAVHERALKGDANADRATRVRLPSHSTSRFGVAGSSQLGGTFAVRRELFEGVGGYRAGLTSLQHTEFFLRLTRAHPLLTANWTHSRCIAIGERRESLRSNRELAARRVESAELILREHGLLKPRSADVAPFLDASAFYAHVAGRRREEWKFARRAMVRRPSLERALRLLRVLTPVPKIQAPAERSAAIVRLGQESEPTTTAVVSTRGGDQADLVELCRTLARTPGVAEVVVVVDSDEGALMPDVGSSVARIARRAELNGSPATLAGVRQLVHTERVLVLDEQDVVVPAGLVMLLELAQMSDVSGIVAGTLILESGIHHPNVVGADAHGLLSNLTEELGATTWSVEVLQSVLSGERPCAASGSVDAGAPGTPVRCQVSGFPTIRRRSGLASTGSGPDRPEVSGDSVLRVAMDVPSDSE